MHVLKREGIFDLKDNYRAVICRDGRKTTQGLAEKMNYNDVTVAQHFHELEKMQKLKA